MKHMAHTTMIEWPLVYSSTCRLYLILCIQASTVSYELLAVLLSRNVPAFAIDQRCPRFLFPTSVWLRNGSVPSANLGLSCLRQSVPSRATQPGSQNSTRARSAYPQSKESAKSCARNGKSRQKSSGADETIRNDTEEQRTTCECSVKSEWEICSLLEYWPYRLLLCSEVVTSEYTNRS